jgi:hypothetical protein
MMVTHPSNPGLSRSSQDSEYDALYRAGAGANCGSSSTKHIHFATISDGLAYLESGRAKGKVVVTMK